MASGLIKIGKKRGLESAQEKAETERPGALSRLGRARDTEKNRGGIPGAIGYLGGNVATGAGQMVEGIVDVGMAGADLLRGDTDMAQYRFLKNVTKEWDEELERSYNPGTVMQIGGDVASGIGTSLVFMIPKAGIFLGAAGTFGSNVSQAAEMTGEVGLKELGYAAAATVPEILLEKTIGAATRGGKALFSAGSKALTKGTAKAGVKTVGKTATKVSKSLLGHVALETAKGMAGEGAEEAITEAIDPFLLRLFKIDENAQLDMGNVLYAGLIGSLSGGLMTSGPAAINYKSSQAAGRMIREAGLTDAFLDETRELLGGADRAKTKAEVAKGEKVTAADGSGVIGKVTAMGKNTVNTVRQSKIASSAKRIAETTRKNLQSFEQFNAKENKTAQEQAIADAMLGELRGNVYLLETSYLSETYEQAILDATPEQKQDIVDFINKSMAAKNAAKSDYTVADLDADTDGILTSMAAKYVEGDLERYTGIRRVDSMEGRGQKGTETAEEAATSPWSGLADGEDVSAFGATGEAEEALLAAAVRESVPKGSIPEMLAQFRKGTAMSPEEFASAWSDGAHIFGRYGFDASEDGDTAFNRMEPEAREAAMKFGRETEEAERKASEEKAKAKKKPAEMAGKKGTVVRGEGLNVQKLSDEQYAAYKAAELLAEVLGTDIVIETKILTKKGKKANGYYDRKDNTIHVNINALRGGKNVAMYTLGHEITHYIKEWSPTKFEALADFVLDQMGVDAETAVAEKLASLKRLGIVTDTMTIAEANAMAREELVAEGMELVLTDGKVLEELSKTDKSLWEKIRDWFFDIIGQIRRSWQDLNQASKTAQVLKETVESLEEIERMFTEGVTEAGERTRTAEAGVIVDDASGTAMLSVDDIPKTEQEIDDAVNRLVAKLGVDESRARKWVEDEISLATLILRDDMVDYAHRKADRRLTAIVKNSDYKQGTLDFSNICRKRREYTRMMQRIQQAFPNRRFTAEEFATIRKIMVDEGLEVACGLCYVEDRRQNEGYIAETFQRAVEAWRKGNRDTYYDTKNNVENAYNKGQAKAMALLEGGDYVPTIADLTTVEGMEKLQSEHPDILRAWRGFNNARGMASARLLTGEAEYQRQILKYSKARVKQINDLGGLRVFSFSDFEEFHLLDIIQAVQDCAAMGIKIQFYTKVPSFALLMADTKAKGNLSLIPKGDLGYEMKNGKRVLVYDPVEGIDFNDPAFKKVARGNPNIGTILVGINDDHIRTAMEDDFIDYIIPFHTGQTEVVRQIKKIGKWQNYKNEQVDKPWESGSKAKPVNVYTDVIAAAEREGNPIRNERQFVERFLRVCEERGLRPRFSRFLNTNAEGKYVYTKGYYKLLLDFKMFDKDGTYLPQEPVIPEFDADLLHELTEKYVAGEKAKTEAESPAFKRALERVEAEVVGDDEGRMYSIDDNSLVEKYPTLNLNQDISNMDGVPAIQLEDGSVLTFTEPHVTFIQNSGIDVEDIRSGGWIADGVYEPSERSDTLRYKERMLAKKRMDEKRAAKKGDIRYSIDETPDTAYLAAVERGDMVTAQKMVDEAAKEAGYTVKAHHGTRAEFTVFSKDAIGSGATLFASQGKGFYFAADKATATKYARGGKVLSVCLRLEKPFVFKNKRNKEVNKLLNEFAERYGQTFDIKDYDGFVDFEKRTGTVLSRIVGGNGETFTNFLQSKGYDGIEYVSFDYDTRTGIECYVVFDSQNIKSADPVTYDDNGNVIPLSERFKESKSDIRYSIDETPETPDVSENRDLTDREILGMALEGAVQSQEEYNIVKSYREQASMLELVKEKRNGYSKEAAALERQIKALRSRMEEEGDPNGFIRKALDEAIAKKRNAEAMRDEQDRILDNSTKELLKLKAAKPFRELVDREGRRAKAAERKAAKAVESADAKVERTKQRADRRIEQAKAEYESREKYKDDRREVTTRKRAAQRILGSLNTALYNPTKAKHVPLQLHDLVETTLKSADPKQFGINRDHIREMSELAAKIEKLERKAALTGEEQETLNKMKGRYEHLEADTISVKRQAEALNTAFKKYQQQVTEADMMDKDLMDALDGYVAEIEEATLAEMNLKSLIAVERFYTALLHQVNNSNKTFATEKAVAIDKLGTDANTEVKEVKALKFLQPRAMELAGLAGVRGFFWNNMKPLTVFDAIGSETFAKLFKNVMDGEIVWATDLEEAHEFLKKAKKEYGYDKWDLKKRSEITTADGTKVALTLGEKMSLYAYMFREQAEEHLSIGGFTFAPNAKTVAAYKDGKIKYEAVLNDQKQYHMRKEDIVKMAESLTEEQRAYAEAVQKYLTSLGKKGNEVSVKLYGMELFNETAYFPIKSNRDYLETSTGKSGDPNIKSRGTFKETVPQAGNPIVLEDFMEVTTNHINTMATYHAFVLPIEDLTRVWNYRPVNIKRDENGEAILDENGMPVADTDGAAGYNSLKAEITKKYGAEANDYILQLIRDLNGGARRDAAATILDKGLTAFKRAATTMSASTIIQQPTSVIRAMAYVDAKHFSGASITPWETVKKYAKVAFIKEMGGFDTGTGARTQEFLNQREYDNLGQKVKAAVTPEVYGGDPQARAEFFGWLTSKADEKTWCFLFGAVVNEQAERLGKPKDSEEVLKAAGERFTEVVRRTQVYDSTLTRNQYMRSKDGLMKMATSFMAEPSTVVSMAADAIIRLERGDKMFIRKTAAGIAGSIILNAMAVSLIYAMRDDDEEKNYLEKYISSLTGEIVEGLNPLEYFPILRDIMSLFKGYEVERSDMTLINNLLEQVEMITSSKRSFMDKMIGVTGAVAAFFGIPVTNLYRDVKGLTTTTISLFNGEPMTAKGTASAALEGVTDQFGLFKKLFGGDRGTSYELYRAKVSGDKSHYDRVAARYDSPEAEEQALRRELRENDKRIGEAAEARRSGDIEVYKSLVEQITDEGIFDRGMVIRAIQTEMNALSRETEKGTVVPKDTEVADEETVEVVSLYSSSDLNAALERGDTGDFKEIYESMVSDRVQAGKTEAQAKSAVKSSITAYWKPRYIEARNANDAETMKKILQILLSSGLYGSRNDVAVMLEGWIKAYAKSK